VATFRRQDRAEVLQPAYWATVIGRWCILSTAS
jgi:hypothetical protein